MTDDESARMGEQDARRIFAAIDSSLSMPGVNRVHWWGGFVASLTGKCYVDIGEDAHAIITATAAEALKKITTPRGRVQ